jgi:hypothetical protein
VNVDCGLPLLLLDLDVVSRCKGVDVHNTTMSEDLVVNQRREFLYGYYRPILHHHRGGT